MGVKSTSKKPIPRVALRKESVDRNTFPGFGVEIDGVALRKESVDRNFYAFRF